MSMLDALRKGFGFFLMSMGVSAPAKKPAPRPAPAQNTAQNPTQDPGPEQDNSAGPPSAPAR